MSGYKIWEKEFSIPALPLLVMVGGEDLEEAAAAAAAGASLAASRDREFKVITLLLPTLLRVDDEAPV